MIFERLAKFVVNNNKTLIAVWLVVLFFALPSVFSVNDVIAYQETEFLDQDYESQQASDLLSEQFPSQGSGGSSMIIVITNDDLSTPDSRDIVLDIEASITGDPTIKYLDSATSIYDVYAASIESVVAPLAPNMTVIEEQVNLTLQLLYGIPEGYAMTFDGATQIAALMFATPEGYYQAFDGVNQTASMVYGIPLYYFGVWSATMGNDAVADAQTQAYIAMMTAGMDPMNASMVVGYYQAFNASWAMTAMIPDPMVRLDTSIDYAIQGIVSNPMTPSDYAMMLTAINSSLTLTNFMNPSNCSDVAYQMVYSGIPPGTPYAGDILNWTHSSFRSSFTTNPGWDLTVRKALSLQTGHQMFLMNYGQMDETFLMMSTAAGLLGLDNYTNPVSVSNVSYNVMLAGMASYLTDPNASVMATGLLQGTDGAWKASLASNPSLTSSQRLADILPLVHSGFLSLLSTLGLSAEEAALFNELTVVGGNFGLGNYTSAALQHSFMISMIGEQANIANLTFLEEIYALGPAPTAQDASDLAWKVVSEGTIGSYPVSLPTSIRRSFISDDNGTMLMIVSFTKGSGYSEANGSEPITENVGVVRSIARSYEGGNAGLAIYVTGEAPISADMSSVADSDLALIEPITISLVLILMGSFFRSIVGPTVPLLAIGIALGLSYAAIIFIGTFVASVHFIVVTLVIAILFGVGTDYSIFIIARYREELLKGASPKEAMKTSITWAGESIVTSGATVIIAFSVISISSFSMLQTMGLVIGVAIVIALLIALTLVPAIALSLGGRLFWPITGKRWENYRMNYLKKRAAKRGGYFRKAAKFSVNHATLVFAVAIIITLPSLYIITTGETSYDFIKGMAENESVLGLEVMSESFGAGRISPTDIVIQFAQPVALVNDTFNITMLNEIENITLKIESVNDNVHQVIGPTRPNGEPVNYTNMSAMSQLDRTILIMQIKSFIGKDNRTVKLQAIFVEEPYTTPSLDTVKQIRVNLSEYRAAKPLLAGSTILVGGASAGMVDIDNIMSVEFGQMEIGVIIGIFIVLLIVLGSVILPAFALLSIGLSISWTLAAVQLVFGNLLDKPVLWMMPVVLFVILMGLGMDYNVFILTRIREEAVKRGNHEKAIIEAVDRTGGIITACALIMAGAFGSLMVSGTTLLQEFGFALSFAVLLDAMLVRTYLTPAIMKLLGPKLTWWAPGRLQRVHPEKLTAQDGVVDEDF